uniref:Chemokine binding protein n=1 Tax=Orf virus (strain NZ7) TaxID=73495 RepID=Q6SQ64_ORFN7|nr:chemokine binding protein [Orf virus NZ7]
MKAVLLLALLGAFTNAAPLLSNQRLGSAEEEKFCSTHHDKVYARFWLQMRVGVRHSSLYAPSNMCMMDIEDSTVDIEGSTETEDSTVEKEYTSAATGDANGVNVSVALMGEGVSIPLSYIGLGFNPLLKDGYLYVNVSSRAPWDQQTLDLSANDGWGIKQVLEKEILAIQIGCDNQKFPEEPTTTQPPSPVTTTLSPTTTLNPNNENTDTTPTPTGASVDGKRNPDDIDFSLIVDPRCVTSVNLHFEIKDACMDYKQESPLSLKGKYGDGELVKEEIKDVGKNHNMCSLNLNPGH